MQAGQTIGTNNPQNLVLGLADGLARRSGTIKAAHISSVKSTFYIYFLVGDVLCAYCMIVK